jgi:F0F1-type ATP synthase assembly protein I
VKRQPPGLLACGPHFFFSTLIGGYLGYRLDLWAGTDPLWMMVFGALGFVGGILNLFRELKAWNQTQASQKDDEPAKNQEK